MMEKVAGDGHRVREASRPSGDVVLQSQTQELGPDIRFASSKEALQQSPAAADNRVDKPHAASLSQRVFPSARLYIWRDRSINSLDRSRASTPVPSRRSAYQRSNQAN